MTREEHLLIISALVTQQQLIQALADALRSRDVVTAEDLTAFETVRIWDAPEKERVVSLVTKSYLATAKKLGVETGLSIP